MSYIKKLESGHWHYADLEVERDRLKARNEELEAVSGAGIGSR